TKRGRRGALIHHDAVNQRVRGRRGARLVALTSGGAIPDNADYRVVLEPSETFLGTVNEDFAIESMAGDVFQLGNASWRILGINSGTVRVEDAHGQPPGIPFWLGEAPGRTRELSGAVSELRAEVEGKIIEAQQTLSPALSLSERERENRAPRLEESTPVESSHKSRGVVSVREPPPSPPLGHPLLLRGGEGKGEGAVHRFKGAVRDQDSASSLPGVREDQAVADWVTTETGLCESGARQVADYFSAAFRTLGVIPSQKKIVMERFFDESGGMQLVIHAPFGIRMNRAWGLALRKRFCRSFNFELQAAATDDAIVLSLGTQHSFPLE